ncbi:hypothetical protein SAMN04488109_2126 [Chryseolinea serpens]|uniref:Uncharacterized protein n=1 Tax=Chryseolinea serpens TaxID=947013 RepID=A0A1M5N5Z8_9BACT|nr:hypothetical protein SAMN04488109_2126 [Chryseolinea serpens]
MRVESDFPPGDVWIVLLEFGKQVCNKRRDAFRYTTLFIAMYSLICWIVSGTSLLTSTL